MKEKPKPYTTTPRYIPEDVRSGKMSRPEWRVYQWLRINADPYGKVTTSYRSIRDDIYEDVSENYINTVLLSLKDKKYIYYPSRQGRRGSFDVYFGDWLLPDGKIKHLEGYFNQGIVKTPQEGEVETESEVPQTFGVANQRFEVAKSELIKRFSPDSAKDQPRGLYNDTNTYKDIEFTLSKKTFKRTLVADFEPQSTEESRCKEIATEVGEEYINPLLNVLRKHGIRIIDNAWGRYREDRQGGKRIDNPPAYLYGIIKKILLQNQPE
ncbi:MAG: hypothetical protein HYU81_02450 [Candidatus Brennerbacteria bacterium]|nr:hypothetical protein [Candidatus Brennerbacteria bacterium]